MKKQFLFAACLVFIPFLLNAQGLRFSGRERQICERTSFHVLNQGRMRFKDSLTISFDFHLYSLRKSGFLFRVKQCSAKDEITINLFYDGVSNDNVLNVILEGRRFITEMYVPMSEVDPMKDWVPISFTINPKEDKVTLVFDERFTASGSLDLPDRLAPDICFGKSDNLIEIPSFAIRNLSIRGGFSPLNFPLTEDSGNVALSSVFHLRGKVSNPYWLINDSYHWKKLATIDDPMFMCSGYDSTEHRVYVFDKDSIATLGISDHVLERKAFVNKCPVDIFLGSNVFDSRTGMIYAYEPYHREETSPGAADMAVLDQATMKWTPLSSGSICMQLHHHDVYLDTVSNRIMLFGGFGNRRYNGNFYTCDLSDPGWKQAPDLNGDFIWPRYFSAMGYDRFRDRLYIYGGKGNEAGHQLVGGEYMYNLYSVDINHWNASCMWQIAWEGMDCVAVRNLIMIDPDNIYTLCYPEGLTESYMYLYRISVADGKRTRLADAIPIYSDRITTNANLYYDSTMGQFIATVEESPDDVRCKVSVYLLAAPAGTAGMPTVVRKRIQMCVALALLLLIIFIPSGIFFCRNRKKILAVRKIRTTIDVRSDKPNAIMLFGLFTALDRDGKDISARFTDKLRMLFYTILRESRHDGVSSKVITALLWPEKEEENAKNIRGVTLSYLRKLLSEFDGISLEFNDGRFRIVTEDAFRCDYIDFMNLATQPRPDMDIMLSILARGKFLQNETDSLLDGFKNEVENKIEPILRPELAKRYRVRQYSNCILCADVLLNIDPLNEEAISYIIRSLNAQGRVKDARVRYQSFITLYQQDYGESYPRAFESMLEEVQ